MVFPYSTKRSPAYSCLLQLYVDREIMVPLKWLLVLGAVPRAFKLTAVRQQPQTKSGGHGPPLCTFQCELVVTAGTCLLISQDLVGFSR